MRLEREGESGLAIVLDDGTRVVVNGARVEDHRSAPPNYNGDRGYWSDAAVMRYGGAVYLRVFSVTAHEGGVSRSPWETFRSNDEGRSWARDPSPPTLNGVPELASLSTASR